MTGPWFCVFGAVFLNRIIIQPLTDFVPLTVNLLVPDQVNRVARFFYALLIAFGRLCRFYQNLALTPSDQRSFPYVREFQYGDKITSFEYIRQLTDDDTRTIWKARTVDGLNIVVKFVPTYNCDAHEICANVGYAPKLLYYSNEEEAKRLGGLRMVVMLYIDGISLDQKHKKGEIKNKFCKAIYDDVKSAIQLLHEKDFVFADLRTPNILVFDTKGSQRAMLIDFDWCGRHNVDKYPPSMNPELPWPSGVKPCALLNKEHDIFWLGALRKFLKYALFLPFNNLFMLLGLLTFAFFFRLSGA